MPNTLGKIQKYSLVEAGIHFGEPAVEDALDSDILSALLANPDVNVLTDDEYASLLGLIIISGTLPDYIHVQAIASTTWIIPHGMEGTPDVRFVDTLNNEIEPAIVYDTVLFRITATFASPMAGVATVEGVFSGVGGIGNAFVGDPLSQFASTTSAQLAGVISDETGAGLLVFNTNPVLVNPILGLASCTSLNKVAITQPVTGATLTIADGVTLNVTANATVSGSNTGDQTNITGNAGTVTTIPALSGEVSNVGNNVSLLNASVIGKVLTGYVSGAGTILATDTILEAIQKLNANDATNANLTGEVTSVGNATTMVNASVISKILTGYVSGAGVISATDTILQAIQKLNGNMASFTTTDQVITSGGLLSIAHGLASIPKSVSLSLICQIAEQGYAIGDVLFMDGIPVLNNQGVSISPTATVINIRYGSAGSAFSIPNKGTGATANATNANWRLRILAKV